MRLLRYLLLGLVSLGLLVGTPGDAGAQAPEATARIRHQTGCCWVWFGPANYHGGGGSYGITITGPGGAVLDQGFSSTICSRGATWPQSVTNYFRAKRQGLRQAGYQFIRLSNIVHPNGTGVDYRRQRIVWRRTVRGVVKRGEFEFDYDFSTFSGGTNYCYARNLGIYSNQRVWTARRPTLISINRSLAYSGPGACDPSPSTPC